MDASNVTNGSGDNEIQKSKSEELVETNILGKRRNSTSPSLTDEPAIKKIKSDCDQPENKKDNDEENIQQPVKRREEAEKFLKLYRLLHENDDISEGLSAKKPNAKEDVATHVATGSRRGYSSQYISTCASLYKAESFRNLKLKSGYKWGMKHIAEIDVGSLPEDVTIIDLRTNILRKKYEINDKEVNEKFHKFAESHQEVLLVGKVPESCLKLIKFTGVVPDSDKSSNDSDDFGFDYDSYNSNPDSDSDCY
ncbi:uncharacterized protein LOC127707970 [Mytilus californianus]|uniref:uncharacterized protein LOC127707970 n=1 Tax=Mytilus californianus TaxID=6549 RepID=UPI0022466FF9|nr:uncharacterized protein LOC127707970 [Mytilus californianus]